MNSSNSLPAALIFDMDGVLVDSNPFHLRKWIELLNEHGIPYDPKELPSQILGHRNDTAFRRFFGPDITREESRRLSEELEARFREEFKPHAKPDPEIYLKAARKLDCDPAASVAFEDSFVGIEAAKRAGMKCVAIASTFPFEKLEKQTRADLTVTGFEEVDLERLGLLFKNVPRRRQGPTGNYKL